MKFFNTSNIEAETSNITSHGFRQGGWNVCLHGNSCILSPTSKFSLQIAHSASCPNLSRISSVSVMTGSFATTSLLAGGTLGVALSVSSI